MCFVWPRILLSASQAFLLVICRYGKICLNAIHGAGLQADIHWQQRVHDNNCSVALCNSRYLLLKLQVCAVCHEDTFFALALRSLFTKHKSHQRHLSVKSLMSSWLNTASIEPVILCLPLLSSWSTCSIIRKFPFLIHNFFLNFAGSSTKDDDPSVCSTCKSITELALPTAEIAGDCLGPSAGLGEPHRYKVVASAALSLRQVTIIAGPFNLTHMSAIIMQMFSPIAHQFAKPLLAVLSGKEQSLAFTEELFRKEVLVTVLDSGHFAWPLHAKRGSLSRMEESILPAMLCARDSESHFWSWAIIWSQGECASRIDMIVSLWHAPEVLKLRSK